MTSEDVIFVIKVPSPTNWSAYITPLELIAWLDVTAPENVCVSEPPSPNNVFPVAVILTNSTLSEVWTSWFIAYNSLAPWPVSIVVNWPALAVISPPIIKVVVELPLIFPEDVICPFKSICPWRLRLPVFSLSNMMWESIKSLKCDSVGFLPVSKYPFNVFLVFLAILYF